MNFDRMRALILEQAVQGKLVPQLESEPEVDQIGSAPNEAPFDIPEKWKWVQLRSVGKIIGGGTPKTNVPENWENGKILWFTPSDLGKVRGLYAITSARKITLTGLQNSAATMMPKDTVLFSSRAPIGHIALAPIDCCTNQGCKSFIANCSYISPLWAYWVLYSRTNDIISRASGTTFKEISAKGMSETWIPLPPIQEQNRIVNRIQKLLPLIDSAEKAFTDLQSLSETLRRRLLQHAIRGKLVPQLESEPKVKQIGEVPEDVPFDIPEKWAWIQLGELINYGSSKQIEGSQITPSTWVLDLEDIEKNSGKLLKKKYGTKTTSNKSCFKKGDVLYGKLRPYLNKVLIADEDGCCSTEIVPISVSSAKLKLDAEFLSYFLRSPYFVGYANSCAYGVKMPRLGTKDAKSAWVAIPPLKEQRRIVTHINELLSKVECLKAN